MKSNGQEMNCKAIVNSNQIQGVDKKIFNTLEQAIETFVNTRKWTDDSYEPGEKIEVVYSLVLDKKIEGVEGGYTGSISIQSTRPIYNSDYSSTMINFVDKDFAIKYIQYQPLDFNDGRVTGSDALASNLTAVIAYYTYLAIGLDYDSFSLKGGTPYFNKALNVVNNAPENREISGWKASESKRRNRYWLVDQILSNRFSKFREAFYKYHMKGLDAMVTDPETARRTINGIFPDLKRIGQDNPSSMLMQFFFNAKSEEIIDFLRNADQADKEIIIPICSLMDVRNAQEYFKLMK
jgi:hypothetical protein